MSGITPIVTWTGVNGGGPIVTPLTTASQTTTDANLIVACISSDVAISSVTDSKSNTYTQVTGSPIANGGGDQVSIWYTFAPAVGSGHTISANWGGGGAQHVTLCCRAYSGMLTSPEDKYAEGTGSSSSLDSSATATTTVADELLIGSGTVSSGTDLTFSGTNGWTVQSQSGQASGTTTGFLADKIVSATGAYNATITSTQSGAWACNIATFKGTPAIIPATQIPFLGSFGRPRTRYAI